MITKRQKEVLDFVTKYQKNKGYAPSLEEICKKFKLASVSTAHFHVKRLEELGYLNKQKNQPRAIDVCRKGQMVKVLVLGIIAAGQPIEAIENREETIAVPKSKLPRTGEIYALRVVGNSMIDENINDGDIVLVKQQGVAENGQKVVALIDNYETTLKKFYQERGQIRLQPANKKIEPIIIKKDRDFTIQGIVIDIIKTEEPNIVNPLQQKEIKKYDELPLNKFICGDVLDIMKLLPDNCIHLAITSPPYNVGKNYDNHFDKMKYRDYLDWLYEVWTETKRVLVPGGRFALNIAPTGIKDFIPIHHDFANQLRRLRMKFRTEIIWYKQTMLKRTAWGSFKSPSNPHIVPSWEYVLIFSKDIDRLDGDSKKADIRKEEFMQFSDGFWQIWPETKRKGHPAPFPEKLIYRLIKFYTYKDNNVLDMFGGTGTVAAVAAKTDRNFIHIDISKQYCEVAKDRIDKILN